MEGFRSYLKKPGADLSLSSTNERRFLKSFQMPSVVEKRRYSKESSEETKYEGLA